MIRIISPGVGAAVQDLGRTGLGHIGVGQSGALDRRALRLANAMIGNCDSDAGIEVTLGGLSFEVVEPVTLAITGADTQATLDGRSLPRWWARHLQAGQTVRMGHSRTSMRAYIALAGGIDVPVTLGSRATDAKGGFGGLDGRALKASDRLSSFAATRQSSNVDFGLSPRAWPDLWREGSATTEVRFIPAAEWDDHDTSSQQLFCTTDWTIEPASNRIGYRLDGPVLVPVVRRELLSHGVLPGTIQLPPSGRPIIQMADANTVGGYPKLGVVIDADLSRLAQATLGSRLTFRPVTSAHARSARREEDALVLQIRRIAACQSKG
jgi:biotin-dependent carboxylase-like uncharacterized protein